jgi:hypothetical protein
VPVSIVDVLEMIDVDHDERRTGLPLLILFQACSCKGIKAATVHKSRKLVAHGKYFHLERIYPVLLIRASQGDRNSGEE